MLFQLPFQMQQLDSSCNRTRGGHGCNLLDTIPLNPLVTDVTQPYTTPPKPVLHNVISKTIIVFICLLYVSVNRPISMITSRIGQHEHVSDAVVVQCQQIAADPAAAAGHHILVGDRPDTRLCYGAGLGVLHCVDLLPFV